MLVSLPSVLTMILTQTRTQLSKFGSIWGFDCRGGCHHVNPLRRFLDGRIGIDPRVRPVLAGIFGHN